MALTHALRSQDHRFACRIAGDLLQEHPKDEAKLLDIIESHKDAEDATLSKIKCPGCSSSISCGDVSCGCGRPILFCWRSCRAIETTDVVRGV